MRKQTNEFKLRPLVAATLAALALSAPLAASAQQAQTGQALAAQGTGGIAEIYKASNWLGRDVQNAEGEEIGEVADLVFDDMGRVQYVVLEHGGFLSIGEDYVVVPFGAFAAPVAQDHLILAVSKQQLATAPSFGQNNWPNMAQSDFQSRTVDWYGTTRGAQASGQATAQAGSLGEVSGLSRQQEQLFARLDANDDGVLSPEEAANNEQLQQQYTRLDSYGNDRLTRSEFAMFEIEEGEGVAPGEPEDSEEGTTGSPAYEEGERRIGTDRERGTSTTE